MTDASRIVVAVDTAGSADDAVEWAAAEAAARGLGLRIVHALGGSQSVAEQTLATAATRACSIASDLDVITEALHGPAAWAVEQAALGAPLLVLGSRGRPALRRVLGGSVAGRLAARAPCPVVVVRHQQTTRRVMPAVVLGASPGSTCLAAIGFSFEAAWQRRVPLRLVTVAPDPGTLNALAGMSPERDPVLAAVLDPAITQTLTRSRQRFPGVEVTVAERLGDVTTVLLAESCGAALLVLGSPGGRRGNAWHLTSVGQRLLPRAACPVAVIPANDVLSRARPGQQAQLGPGELGEHL